MGGARRKRCSLHSFQIDPLPWSVTPEFELNQWPAKRLVSAGSDQVSPTMRTRQAKRRARRGFSLLEVLLATTILLGAVVVLGELSRLALHNATAARNHTRGAELCARTMAEIVSGIRPASATTEQPFLDDPSWRFAVELLPCDTPGLSCVQVTCRQEVPENKRPIEVRLARWVRGGATSAIASPTSEPSGAGQGGAGQSSGAPTVPRASLPLGSMP